MVEVKATAITDDMFWIQKGSVDTLKAQRVEDHGETWVVVIHENWKRIYFKKYWNLEVIKKVRKKSSKPQKNV